MDNKFSWQIGRVNSATDANLLRSSIESAGMGAFPHQIRVYPDGGDGKFSVFVEVDLRDDVDAQYMHQELAQLLAYFFRLHNETQGAKVELNLEEHLHEAD